MQKFILVVMLASMFLLAGCKISGGGGGGSTATSSTREVEPITQIYRNIEAPDFTEDEPAPESQAPVVPEPGTIALLNLGLSGLAISLLKRKTK